MNTVIARVSLFGQQPGGERFDISVEIGTPYQCGCNPGEWACPVTVLPLLRCHQDAHGGDSFQSLCLAISLAQNILQTFRENGGSLTCSNGDQFPLECYSFGIAARRSAVIDHRPTTHADGQVKRCAPGHAVDSVEPGIRSVKRGSVLRAIISTPYEKC